MDVRLEKFDEVYLRVKCEPSVARELSDFFTYEVPNAKFMPSVRKRYWDGKIRLFNMGTGKIYLGLFPYVRRFLNEQGHKIAYDQNLKPTRRLDRNLTIKWVQSLEKDFKARDYQIDAIHNILECDRGLILSPTGSGKSFIIYALTLYYIAKLKTEKVLIVVPTTSLVEQMYSDFEDYGWESSKHCHKLYAGADKITDKEVIISTWQSIFKLSKNYFKQFGAVFIDECHLAKAKSLTGIMTKLTECKYRIGTTGTLDDTEIHKLVLEGLFSVHHKVTTTSQLIKAKQLSNLEIKCLVLEHPIENRIERTYQKEMSYLAESKSRNKFISKLTLSLNGNTLVLAQYIRHLEYLHSLMSTHDQLYFVYGGTDADDREDIRKIVETQNKAIIVASYGVFSMGINIKRLHNIIFASPYKSQIKVLQSIGRGLRTAEDKQHLSVFDICDNLSYNNRQNFTLKHFGVRVEIYNQEEFDYEIVPITLKHK